MIFLMFSLIVGIVVGKNQEDKVLDKSELNPYFFPELDSENTLCIEICTEQCIKDSDVYKCFDNCTYERCLYDSGDLSSLDKAEGVSAISFFVIFAGFFLIATVYFWDKSTTNADYKPL